MRSSLIALLLVVAVSGCRLKDDSTEFAAPPDVAAPPPDALKTPSGIASKVLQVGLGSIHPKPTSTVRVLYTGWTTDGKMFDSSRLHGGPAIFQVNEVIPGWTEALQLMVVGEKRRVWIPGSLAYDKSPNPDDPKGTLVFEIELLDVR